MKQMVQMKSTLSQPLNCPTNPDHLWFIKPVCLPELKKILLIISYLLKVNSLKQLPILVSV